MTFKYISLRELESKNCRYSMVELDNPEISGTYFFEFDPDVVDVKGGRAVPSVAYRQIKEFWSDSGGVRYLTVEIKNPRVLEAIASVVEVDPKSIDNVSELGFPGGEE